MPEKIEVKSERLIKFIEKSTWFKGVSMDVAKSLVSYAEVVKYRPGESVYGPKLERKDVYGILTGKVKVSFVGAGEQYFSIIDLHEEFWMGDSAMLANQSKVIDVRAITDSQIIIIPADKLAKIADDNLYIYRNLYYDKIRQTQLVYDMAASVLTYPLSARLSLRLLSIIDNRGRATEYGVCLSPEPTVAELSVLAMGSEQRVGKIIEEWMTFEYIISDPDKDCCYIPNVSFFETEAIS